MWLRLPQAPDEEGDVRAHMPNAILVERGIANARPYPAHDAPGLLFAGLQG